MVRMAFLSAALLIVASCGEPPTRPTQVTGQADPPKPGEIIVGEITPGTGATLVFRACGPAGLGLCTDQLRTTFDVLVSTDVPNAGVVVSLHQGSTLCASAFVRTTLKAGNRTSFSASSFSMDVDEQLRLLCPMPIETTSLAFKVFYENAAPALLVHELPYRYTLTTQ